MESVLSGKSNLILASASIRRRQLLNLLDIHYDVQVANIDESVINQEKPLDYVLRVASHKAETVWGKNSKSTPVLAADTTINLDGLILGKPNGLEDARRYLHLLSGNEHQVLTAVALYSKTGVATTHSVTTVKFKKLSEMQISSYCNTGEPLDKAGAYAIQGRASAFIEYFHGSYTGVMGLPLCELAELLTQIEI